jgi:hypothetical protein
MILKYFLFIIALVLIVFNSQSKGQDLLSGKTETPKELILKVSQFGQFVKRFNYEEDFWGNAISPSFSKKVDRNAYLNMLFNKLDRRFENQTSVYSQLKNDFIKDVLKKNYTINRGSDSLYSVAICEVNYRNNPSNIKLVLKQQRINKGLAWVICDVSSDFLYVSDKNNSDSFNFIPPTSNEVNYIHLKSLFEKTDSLASYAYPGYTCNRLSIFFHLLHTGDIEYKHVTSVVYFINDIPGWIIQVKEFVRNGENSGWLIDDIYRNVLPMDQFMRMAVDNLYF